jgi:hypothetical protein
MQPVLSAFNPACSRLIQTDPIKVLICYKHAAVKPSALQHEIQTLRRLAETLWNWCPSLQRQISPSSVIGWCDLQEHSRVGVRRFIDCFSLQCHRLMRSILLLPPVSSADAIYTATPSSVIGWCDESLTFSEIRKYMGRSSESGGSWESKTLFLKGKDHRFASDTTVMKATILEWAEE